MVEDPTEVEYMKIASKTADEGMEAAAIAIEPDELRYWCIPLWNHTTSDTLFVFPLFST